VLDRPPHLVTTFSGEKKITKTKMRRALAKSKYLKKFFPPALNEKIMRVPNCRGNKAVPVFL